MESQKQIKIIKKILSLQNVLSIINLTDAMTDSLLPTGLPTAAVASVIADCQRSNKKPNHNLELENIPEEMEVQAKDEASDSADPGVEHSWAHKLFPDPPLVDSYPQFYLGEDEEEKFTGVDALFQGHSDLEEQHPPFGPRVEISKEKYTSLFRQWCGALIIKLLGKSVSFRTLDQRLRDLWQLETGFELTDLAEDFYIARLYSREDYLRVLDGGPWVILGHYLML